MSDNPSSAEEYIRHGISNYYQGKYDAAVSDFDRALALNPECAEAYHYRGLAYLEKAKQDFFQSNKTIPQVPAPQVPAAEKAPPKDSLEENFDESLFRLLRRKRKELADSRMQPAFCIFGDRTLKDLIINKPTTLEAFSRIYGLGEKRTEQFGEIFVNLIREHIGTLDKKKPTADHDAMGKTEESITVRSDASLNLADEDARAMSEDELIDKYLFVYEDLWHGKKEPRSECEKNFMTWIECARAGLQKPDVSSGHAMAYWSYRKKEIARRANNMKEKGMPEREDGVPSEDWGIRSEWEAMRRRNFGDINSRGRGN